MQTRLPHRRRTACRAVLLASSVIVTLVPAACKKSSDAIPAGDANTGSADSSAVKIAYQPGARKLRVDGKITFTGLESNDVSMVALDMTGNLDISDAGPGKLKVLYSVVEVREAGADENLKGGVSDLPAWLKAANGAQIVDLHGDVDDAATEVLPENASTKQSQRSFMKGLVDTLLVLPSSLPPKPLAEGTPLVVDEPTGDVKWLGITFDMGITLTYTLLRVDASSGKRIAEIQVASEGAGAQEGDGKVATFEVSTEGVLRFNVDDGIPVSRKIRWTRNLKIGGVGPESALEMVITIDSTYTPV